MNVNFIHLKMYIIDLLGETENPVCICKSNSFSILTGRSSRNLSMSDDKKTNGQDLQVIGRTPNSSTEIYNNAYMQQNRALLEELRSLHSDFTEFGSRLLDKLDTMMRNSNTQTDPSSFQPYTVRNDILALPGLGIRSTSKNGTMKQLEQGDHGTVKNTSAKKRKAPSSTSQNKSAGDNTVDDKDKVDDEDADDLTQSRAEEDDNDEEDEESETEQTEITKKKRVRKNSKAKGFADPKANGYKCLCKPKDQPNKGERGNFDTYSRYNLFEVINTGEINKEHEGRIEFLWRNDDDLYQVLPAKYIPKIFGWPLETEDGGKRYKLTPVLAKLYGNRYKMLRKKTGEVRMHAIYPDDYYINRLKGEIDETKAADSYLDIFNKSKKK